MFHLCIIQWLFGPPNWEEVLSQKTQLKCESAVSTLLVNINNIRYRESLITLRTIIMFVMSVLKNLKCPIMEAQVLCLFFWCFGYFWFYDRVHSICFGVFWHMIICHFSPQENEMPYYGGPGDVFVLLMFWVFLILWQG